MKTPVIRAKLELVPQSDIKAIELLDAKRVSTTPDTYVSQNELGYYILTNTWMKIIHSYSVHGYARVIDKINRVGLLPVIKEADEAANSLVHGDPVGGGMFPMILRDVDTALRVQSFAPVTTEKDINLDPMATKLFLLRYPKRFSPLCADKVIQESISDFLQTENRTKLIQRKERPYDIIRRVRCVMTEMLDWEHLIEDIDKVLLDNYCLTFSSGATSDASAVLGRKLRATANEFPEYFRAPMGIPYAGVYPTKEEHYWGKLNPEVIREVQVRAVPKSYKAARIIAMESTVRQAKATEVERILARYIPANIPLRDQSQNQRLAAEGAACGNLATLDLSHASDCISKTLFWDIFPSEFSTRVYPLLGTHTVVNGQRRVMQQMSTAGNALTFILESMVFYAISEAALQYADSAFQLSLKDWDLPIPSVYGDDIITYTDAAEITIQWLERLGFIVNEDKSFFDREHPYRESCGAEFWDLMDVSSLYFPRFPIVGDMSQKLKFSDKYRVDRFTDELSDSVSSLVSLQHRLFHVCYEASFFILVMLKEAYPKFTTSSPDYALGDLWDYEDMSYPRLAPAGRIEVERYKEIILRRTLVRLEVPEQTRTAKFLPSTVYTVDERKISDCDRRLYDLYRYNEFLRHGPRYDDALLESLGISSAPRTLRQAYGTPSVKWSLKEVDYQE